MDETKARERQLLKQKLGCVRYSTLEDKNRAKTIMEFISDNVETLSKLSEKPLHVVISRPDLARMVRHFDELAESQSRLKRISNMIFVNHDKPEIHVCFDGDETPIGLLIFSKE